MRAAGCLSLVVFVSVLGRAHGDAFDQYFNDLLSKAPASKNVTKVAQLTPEVMVRHARVLPSISATFLIVKTNLGRMAKLLVHPARQRINAEESVPILFIERYVTFRDGEERTIQAQGQNLQLYHGFRLSLDLGQVVPEALAADLRFVSENGKEYLEPVGKAELYLVTKHFPEATPQKSAKVVIGEKFEPRYFNGTFKLYDDGRRSGILKLKVTNEGDVTGVYYSDKDGQKYDVSGKVGSPAHAIQFTVTFPRSIQAYQGMMFTGDGRIIAGTAKLQDRETAFYAVRQDVD